MIIVGMHCSCTAYDKPLVEISNGVTQGRLLTLHYLISIYI